jgi:hypothetical protein
MEILTALAASRRVVRFNGCTAAETGILRGLFDQLGIRGWSRAN